MFHHTRFVVRAVSCLAIFAMLAVVPHTAHADDLISCDTVRNLGTAWRNVQSGRNIGVVACYQVPGGAVLAQGQSLLIEVRVTSGAFDAFVIVGAAAAGEARDARQFNADPILAGTGWQPFVFAPIVSLPYTVVIAPAIDGTRGSYQIRMRAAGSPVVIAPTAIPVLPTPIPVGSTIVLPTTFDRGCSSSGAALSNLCIETYPVAAGGTAYALWRIPNFVKGEFDKGDGAGFRGPINAEMRVDVPNVTAARMVRLKWTTTTGQEYIDSLVIQVGNLAAVPVIDPFPCSRSGVNLSNLCIEQPYPFRAGGKAVVVWRIASFQYGEFDRGDGTGYKGPINHEQRIEITNITSARTVRLRWVDGTGVTREDSFTIQVY